MESHQTVEPILPKETTNASDGGITESTTTTDDDDDDDISTTSSDEALCDVLGLPSLSGMAMVDDVEEENDEDCGESLTQTSNVQREPLIPRRIHLPSVRGVSRKYHPSQECFAYEIPKVLSPDECSELIAVAANSALPNSSSHSNSHTPNGNTSAAVPSSFRYITHAVHTAPDGHTKFEVKLAKPNPHKLAVFRHESWVNALWERIQPVLYNTNHATTIATAQTVDDSHESDTGCCKNDSIPLPIALDGFIEREKLSISTKAPNASPVAGLNPRLRVLKYDALDHDEFQGHFDATTEIHAREQTSYITVLLYLNDGGGVDFAGGETEFLSQDDNEYDAPDSESSNSRRSIRITPQAGSVVLFEHDLFHRGRPLLWGTKYVLRTDIMFANPPSQPITNDSNQSLPSPSSSSSLPEPQNDDDGAMAASTVEDILHGMEREFGEGHNQSAAAALALLREALSEGLGFGTDLHDTSIECLCSPGRFALNLMLREHMLPASSPQQQQQQQHHQRTIDRFLDASFEALKKQQR